MTRPMRATIAVSVFALAAGWALGCGEDDPKKGPATGTGTTSSGTGGDAGGGTGGSSSGTGGTAGGGGAAVEDCYDGKDNDQNGTTDCIDGDPACTELCADPCSAPKVLSKVETQHEDYYLGDNTGFSAVAGTSCIAPDPAVPGATSVFQVTSGQDGVLEVWLSSLWGDNFTLSLRTTCGDAGSELACVENVDETSTGDEYASIVVTTGQTVFILVQSYADVWDGAYTLDARTRVPACGDGIIDAGEECDDQNANAGDGCSPSCALEVSEIEPNDSPPGNAWTFPFVGIIDPPNDTDIVSVTVPGNNYSMLVNTFDLGSGHCGQGKLDSYLVVYDSGMQTVGSDDDSGDGFCASAAARGLSAGTYYVRVARSPKAPPDMTFFYALYVEMDECGNNVVAAAEQCDDGNTQSGDGCSAGCIIE